LSILPIKDIKISNEYTIFTFRNPYVDEFSFNTNDPVRYVRDRITGVEYGINLADDTCVVRGYKRYSFDSSSPDLGFNAAFDFISKLETNGKLLDSDVTYVFTGQRRANGIRGDRYITKVASDIYEYVFSPVNYKPLFDRPLLARHFEQFYSLRTTGQSSTNISMKKKFP
jgi:hypothetical protein